MKLQTHSFFLVAAALALTPTCAVATSDVGETSDRADLAAKQDTSFPDVPQNHWAYQAIARLKSEGILVGYPDGLFRGSRPLSRYEMAVAMHAAYAKLMGFAQGVADALKSAQSSSGASQDRKDLSDHLARIQGQIDEFKTYGQDVADLKRASDTFELELEQLGVDVEAMKKNLQTLDQRVSALEKRRPAVDIHGDVNFWLGAGESREHSYGLNKDGRIVGTTAPGGVTNLFPPVDNAGGFLHDSTVLHEAAFTLSSTNDKGPRWFGSFVVTDMFGRFAANNPAVAFGNQSDIFSPVNGNAGLPASGLLGYATGPEDLYVQHASVVMGGPKANVELGRVAYSMSPYMFRRIDNTSYFSNERWDDGKYTFDGVLAGATVGPAKLTVFGGRNSGILSARGVELNPLRSQPIGGFLGGGDPTVASGVLNFDRSIGADLRFGAGKTASLDFGYVLLESDMRIPIDLLDQANHLSVYGADGRVGLGSLRLMAGYHKSDIQNENHTVEGRNNSASNLRLQFDRSFLRLFAEYRRIEANYIAPGDWGRLGVLRDPTNIQGIRIGGRVRFLKKFSLAVNGNFESGLSNDFAASTFLGTKTEIRGYDVRLNFDPNSRLNLFAQLEDTHIGNLASSDNYVGSGNPNYRWATLGLRYKMSDSAQFRLQYELDDVFNDYQVSGGANFHGGFLTSQLSVKF